MNILINTANISGGGGAQVADSICRYLNEYSEHKFIVVLSKALDNTAEAISDYPNVIIERYNCRAGDIKSLITFRNKCLDKYVEKYNIECVFTVFGPIKWRPECTHICGFGLSHIVMPESPFFQKMSLIERVKWTRTIKIWEYIFGRSSDMLITENPLISERLQNLFRKKKIVTITNNYNQVFDNPSQQKCRKLPSFNGTSFLDVTAFGPHKNTTIAIKIAAILKEKHPSFKCRFIFTFERNRFPDIPTELNDYFYFTGRIGIEECPSLYDQCDVEFQPTLLECFTATYPEAMRMGKPIVTVDLPFAHGLCGDAALYYSPLSADAAADCLYKVATDINVKEKLVEAGKIQLQSFDTSRERADKVIKLCEKVK